MRKVSVLDRGDIATCAKQFDYAPGGRTISRRRREIWNALRGLVISCADRHLGVSEPALVFENGTHGDNSIRHFIAMNRQTEVLSSLKHVMDQIHTNDFRVDKIEAR
jgi:hypothetical protein